VIAAQVVVLSRLRTVPNGTQSIQLLPAPQPLSVAKSRPRRLAAGIHIISADISGVRAVLASILDCACHGDNEAARITNTCADASYSDHLRPVSSEVFARVAAETRAGTKKCLRSVSSRCRLKRLHARDQPRPKCQVGHPVSRSCRRRAFFLQGANVYPDGPETTTLKEGNTIIKRIGEMDAIASVRREKVDESQLVALAPVCHREHSVKCRYLRQNDRQ
jgi:hypothetical protein